MATKVVTSLIYDLLHKPLDKNTFIRLFSNDHVTRALAEKAHDVVKRREGLNYDFFDQYINYWARTGDINKMKDIVTEAREYGIEPPDRWNNAWARTRAHAFDFKGAVRDLTAARELGSYDARAHESVVRLLANAAHRKLTQGVENRRKSETTERETDFAEIDEMLEQCVTFARSMRDRKMNFHDPTHVSLIAALRYRGKYQDALEIAEWAHELGLALPIMDYRFLAAASRGEFQNALELLPKIHRPEIIHYSVLIANCRDQGDLKTWNRIIGELLKICPVPATKLANNILEIYGKREAFEEMERVLSLLPNPDINTYGRALMHYTYAGRYERSRQLLREIAQRDMRMDIAFEHIMTALIQRKDWAQCDSVLSELRSGGVVLGRVRLHYCVLMIPYWASHKHTLDRCITYIMDNHPGVRMYLLNLCLAELAKHGNVLACVEVMRVLRAHHRPTAMTYRALFQAAAQAQLRDAHELLFEGMRNDNIGLTLMLRIAIIQYFIVVAHARGVAQTVCDMCAKDVISITKQQILDLTDAANKLEGGTEEAKIAYTKIGAILQDILATENENREKERIERKKKQGIKEPYYLLRDISGNKIEKSKKEQEKIENNKEEGEIKMISAENDKEEGKTDNKINNDQNNNNENTNLNNNKNINLNNKHNNQNNNRQNNNTSDKRNSFNQYNYQNTNNNKEINNKDKANDKSDKGNTRDSIEKDNDKFKENKKEKNGDNLYPVNNSVT